MKFAKVFDLPDGSQALYVVTERDERAALIATTVIEGMEASSVTTFPHFSEQVAWRAAEQALSSVTQEDAERFVNLMMAAKTRPIRSDEPCKRCQGAMPVMLMCPHCAGTGREPERTTRKANPVQWD